MINAAVYAFFLTPALLWISAAVLNLYRLARLFQIEGCDNKHYLRALIRRDEWLYLIIALIALIGFAVTFVLQVSSPEEPNLLTDIVWLVTVYLFCGLHVLWVLWRLRHQQAKQKYMPTQRTNRLLVTAILIVLILTLVVIVIIQSLIQYPFGLRVDTVLDSYSVDGGSLAMLIVPFTISLANLINWPIDRLLGIPRNAPTSQGSNL